MICGINNVYFRGNRQDWIAIRNKTAAMKEYDVDDKLVSYVDAMLLIVSEFINTFDGRVNVAWWNQVVKRSHKNSGGGCISPWILKCCLPANKDEYVDGWILHFFGIYEKTKLKDIPSNFFTSVLIEISLGNNNNQNNNFTWVNGFFNNLFHSNNNNNSKTVTLKSGFVAVDKIGERTYKPIVAVAVFNTCPISL